MKRKQDFVLPQSKKSSAHVELVQNITRRKGDIVEYNQLISKFGSHKQLDLVLYTFEELQKANLVPTIYTYAALMNAYVRCGEIDEARKVHEEIAKPNEITFTTLVKGLSQENQLEQAYITLKEMVKMGIPPNIRTYNAILRGCVQWGEPKIAKKILKKLREGTHTMDVTTYQYLIQCFCSVNKMKEVFEIANEMDKVKAESSIAYFSIAKQCCLAGDYKNTLKYLKYLEKQLVYEKHNNKNIKADRESVSMFIEFRQDEIEQERKEIRQLISKSFKSKYHNILKCPRAIFPTDRVNFTKLFGNDNPIIVEVCAGDGDWITENATTKKDKNWVSLEWRFDRNYSIFSKMCFKDIDNLAIVGGEAFSTLNTAFSKRSIDQIYVNFPNPPVWKKSKHVLVREEFILEMVRVLKQGGDIFVVTDNKGYCDIMAEEFQKVVHKGAIESMFGDLYDTKLPHDFGTSYFDRLWSNGNKTDRFFFHLKKL
jgi:tRNA (guanine-N7-)-methyltransferase